MVIGIIFAVANMESIRRGDRLRTGMARTRHRGKISRPSLAVKKEQKIEALKKAKYRIKYLLLKLACRILLWQVF